MSLLPADRKVLTELVTRLSPTDSLLDGLFDKQLNFVNDSSRFVATRCSRRAGKTHSLIRKAADTALKHRGVRTGYMADTYGHAEGLVWTPLLDLLRENNIPFEANNTKLRVTLGNKSVIQVGGCEDERKARKLLGHAYKVLIIDEAQCFPPFLRRLIHEIIGPAMGDHAGQIIVSGTPEETCTSYFHEITNGDAASQWSQHHWSVLDNQMFPQWAGYPDWKKKSHAWLERERRLHHYTSDDPRYLRDYLGLWVRSTEKMILIVPPQQVIDAEDIPSDQDEKLIYILGIDLGYEDEAAWVILGYSQTERKVYEVDSWSKNHMTLSDTLDKTFEMIDEYKPVSVVIDPARAGNALVAEINQRYGLGAKTAEKRTKADAFSLLRNDITGGEVFFRRDRNTYKQAESLVWNVQRTREREGIPCDLMDAFLYAYRESLHWAAVPEKQYFELGSREQIKEEADLAEEREMEQAQQAMQDTSVDFYG